MASTPKIKVTIPASLQLTASQKAGLKKAFQASVVRVLKRPGSVRNDIINILPAGGASKKPGKKASKKAGKKK